MKPHDDTTRQHISDILEDLWERQNREYRQRDIKVHSEG
jgi:hypothetical protein